MSDIEAMLRRAMLENGCKSISIFATEKGFQANRQNPKDSSAFRVEIMSDPADALFNVLAEKADTKRRDPKRRNLEDLV